MRNRKQFKHRVELAKPIQRFPLGTVLNRDGKPVKAIAAPSGAASRESRIDKLNAWRESYNPLRGLTITRAILLLEDYQVGRMADLQWTNLFMEGTDPDMIGLLENRISRILEMDYDVLTEKEAENERATKRLADEQADFIGENLAAIDNLYQAIEHLAMAPFRGFAHVEKWFNRKGEIFHLEAVDQWNVVRDGLRGGWRYNPLAKSVDYRGLPEEATLPMDRFLYREVRRPINRYALIKFIKASLSDKDWDAFNEIFNVPGGVVVGPPDVPEGDEIEYETAAREVAGGGSGYLPHGSIYTPNEMPHDPGTFEKRLDYLSKKLVLAGTGGMLTMLAESGSGTLAGSVHDEVFNRIARAEARRISEIVTKGMVAGWLDARWPGQPHLAYFQLAANEEMDVGDAVDQVVKLATAGYQVDPIEVTEKTGWSVTLKALPAEPEVGSQKSKGEDQPGTPIKNRASTPMDEVRERLFLAASREQLATADQQRLAPLAAKLAALPDDATDEDWLPAFRAIETEFPALYAAVLADDDALDAADAAVIGTAYRSGLETGSIDRKPAPLRNRHRGPSRGLLRS